MVVEPGTRRGSARRSCGGMIAYGRSARRALGRLWTLARTHWWLLALLVVAVAAFLYKVEIYIYPEKYCYSNVLPSQIPAVLESYFEDGITAAFSPAAIKGEQIFICTHGIAILFWKR